VDFLGEKDGHPKARCSKEFLEAVQKELAWGKQRGPRSLWGRSRKKVIEIVKVTQANEKSRGFGGVERAGEKKSCQKTACENKSFLGERRGTAKRKGRNVGEKRRVVLGVAKPESAIKKTPPEKKGRVTERGKKTNFRGN